jgi:hypothetical protein
MMPCSAIKCIISGDRTHLQAWWRGKTYVVETLKCLPEIPEVICIEQIIAQVAELGRINHLETPA